MTVTNPILRESARQTNSALNRAGYVKYNNAGGFDLSDDVLKVIIGSTAVSAIGLVGLVIRGIFGAAQAD